MEEYFEKKIKFITQGGSINGVLKGFDEENEVFKIIINMEEFNLDVNDVLEMVPQEDGDVDDGSKVDVCKEDGTAESKESECIKGSNECMNSIKGSNGMNSIKKNNIKDTTSTTSSLDLLVSKAQYEEMLRLAFTKFGPTREEFILCGSQNLLKLLKLFLKDDSPKVDIALGENILNNCLGLSLARLLLLHGFDVRVVGEFEDIQSLSYLFIYKKNGGAHSSKIRPSTNFLVNTSEVKALEVGESVSGVISFGIPSRHPVSYVVCFGASVCERVRELESFYLIDVMFPEMIYKEFGLTRRGMRPAKKVKKGVE